MVILNYIYLFGVQNYYFSPYPTIPINMDSVSAA